MLTPSPERRVLEVEVETEGAPIAANTVVLIIVAAVVALALFGMVVGVRYKCRGEQRYQGGSGMLDEAEDDARLVQHHADLAAEQAKAQAARVDSGIEAFRERAKRKDTVVHASETAHLRELLSDRGDRTA